MRLYYANLTSNVGATRSEQAFRGFEAIAVSRTDNPQAAAAGTKSAWMPPVLISRQSSTTFSDKGQVLFCERARAHDPGFQLSASTAAAVAEICRRLDGLPLAIELAAARCGLLSPREIADRLDDALSALGDGATRTPSESPSTIMVGAAIPRTSCSGHAKSVVSSVLSFSTSFGKPSGFGVGRW